MSILEPSCGVIITKTAWQGNILRVSQAGLQWKGALGGGDQLWVGQAELHSEPVLKEKHVRKTTLSLGLLLSLAL